MLVEVGFLYIAYCMWSVSYTHLDVYKRQEICSACALDYSLLHTNRWTPSLQSLLSNKCDNMSNVIESHAKCEVRAVIRFLLTEGRNAADIHRRMSNVYGDNFMSDGCVREWCRKFKEG